MLLKKELAENRWKYIIITIYLAITGSSFYLLFQWLGGLLPELFGADSDLARKFIGNMLEDFQLFAWANWYGKNFYQAMVVFAIILGMSKIAGEISRGTAGFLFTRPLSRRSIYLTKYFAGVSGLAVIIVATTLITMLSAQVFSEPLPPKFLVGILPVLAGSMVIYSITLVSSIIFEDQVKAAAGAAVVAALISIPSWFSSIRYLSIYYHMQGWPIFLGKNDWQLPMLLMLAISGIICWLGFRLIEKKDL
jgi:ABC-type transport system involved in multi-copper enzyme maturation permease subunit